jgi:anti-anti-sigma factor
VLSTSQDLIRIQNEGEITQIDFRPGHDVLPELLGADCYARKVLLNMERTPYIDSAGVGWLVMCHKRFKEAGGRLIIHSIPPMVNQILKLLKMPALLHIAENDAAAQALALGEKP